jgi:peroxiredoxin (alkyl hydroperoxide reductase subunit C)
MTARVLTAVLLVLILCGLASAQSAIPPELIWQPGQLKPTDSQLVVKVGDKAPEFDLPGINGKRVALSQYLGVKNVVLSFIPAAWTPVCSGQWPGYNLAKSVFDSRDAVLVGISCDNLPSLNAWVVEMGGVWFPVASDFWPHGALAQRLGILRSEGISERAIFVIDKKGIIRYIDVHDINSRPDLGQLAEALARLQ